MTIFVEVKQKLGAFSLDAAFSSQGGVTAIFGRSGSGKTSMIRIIAGLARPDHGRLVIDDTVLVDTEKRIFVPRHRRRFGYVFQEGRLFPHLSVRQNLGYGRWFAPRSEASADFDRVIDMLGIGALLDRRPAGLSGGEKQRVAIGRALLSAPRLLLMDEPLAALDEARKAEILPYLQRLRDETATPIVYVSHSVAEVAQLADRVVMMKDGRVEATGTTSEILTLPSADRREAGAVLSGVVRDVDPVHNLVTIGLSAAEIILPNARVREGAAVRIHIPERDVMVAIIRPEGLSALNILEGVVSAIEPDVDGMVRVRIRSGADVVLARITVLSQERLGLEIGKPAFAVIKTVALER
ncbi:molybdenum ABC transporter ATP-binding protein [Neorhizobium sp. NCHU2750]|uniref:molybdenum ABC transporter ATP-binding protein n=1 Tax=Neorhizobium sp. NCHU2750 TaxID=1825976 RepID=UPI000E7490D2|nr:molybdate ABC transporter ATP-binding protein [Neorhizobium sp. NCHU2750]